MERDRRIHITAIREAKDKRGDAVNPVEDTPIVHEMPSGSAILESNPEDCIATRIPGELYDNNDYDQQLRTNHYTVAMRVDTAGQLVVDEDTLIVDRSADPDIAQEEAAMSHVIESDTNHFINSASYTQKIKGCRWSNEETAFFYEVTTVAIL
jgi:transcription factor TFIIIB component B''